ncbi:MAG TPA: glycosyltransferase family 4 protein [Methylococcus sp.]|nr:glycosyltransferase family 4 protein [Methylococcus sp.]
MKIAQIAPLFESVPPRTYGGTERVVHYLTEELVRQGHQVTLFASGDSQTSAELWPTIPEALRLAGEHRSLLAWHMLQLDTVARTAADFDILHFHTDFWHFLLWRHMDQPQLTTLHGRLDFPGLQPIFDRFQDMAVVSISHHQRAPLPRARWVGTVYNGLPENQYRFRAQPGDYLVFLGRFSPEKGPETAIEIAIRAGIPLKMAARVQWFDRQYFEQRIKPKLQHPGIEYLGEVDERGKNELLGGALALLFPIDWPEPFGLVMIEAMACGTPVIAYPRGAVPEVMQDGVTGYIVDSVEAAVGALDRIEAIDRAACRRHFEQHFSARRMAERYVQIYRRLQYDTPTRGAGTGAHARTAGIRRASRKGVPHER